jgi:ABC-2 type transport system permease protein
MSLALLRKTFRDYRVLLLIVMLGMVVFEIFAVRMILEGAKDLALLKQWIERPFLQTILRLALGADISRELSPSTLAVFGLAHPLIYTMSWALLLTIATGVTVGEVQRGTADLLLTLPIARVAVYCTTSIVWIAAAAVASAAPYIGMLIGERCFPLGEPLRYAGMLAVAVTYFCLCVSIGAVTMLVSSLASRRGTAIAIVLSMLLVSDFINLLAQLWPPVQKFAFVGFLYYYRPLPVLLSAELPWFDLSVLLGIAAVSWTAGLIHFARRDIPAA